MLHEKVRIQKVEKEEVRGSGHFTSSENKPYGNRPSVRSTDYLLTTVGTDR